MPIIGNQGGGGGMVYDSSVNNLVNQGIAYVVPAGKVLKALMVSDGLNLSVRLGSNSTQVALDYLSSGTQQYLPVELGAGQSVSTANANFCRVFGVLYVNS